MQQTVVDPEYVSQNYKDLPDDYDNTNCETVSRSHKGGLAKKHVLDDSFWARVKGHVDATMPLFKFIRRHDTSAPSTGKVYYGWYEMGEHLKRQTVPYKARDPPSPYTSITTLNPSPYCTHPIPYCTHQYGMVYCTHPPKNPAA